MCIQMPGKVRVIEGARAIMDDGRRIRLGLLQGIKAGDYLEVYADIALAKLDIDTIYEGSIKRKGTI